MTSPVPAEPATPAEALREVVGYLVFRAVDIGDNRRAAALETADAILREIARSTGPGPAGINVADLLHKLGVADIQTAHEQAHRLGFRVWELAGDAECTPRGSVLEQALELLADPGPAPNAEQPATPTEAVERVRAARRRLASHIIASAHLLDAPFSNAPDQSPWTKIKAAMTAFDEAVAELARSTDPGPAPTTYALPAEPPPEVTELWDKDGDRWVWDDETEEGWVPDYTDGHWEWKELVVEYGPLSSVPPGTEPSPVVDSCLSCNGPLVRRDGKLVHQATGERTCPPPGTEASQ